MPSHSILIADDEPAQREALAGFLKKKGYQILVAGNGSQAIDTVHGRAVDLLLTDMRMPGMDGIEVLRRVKEINPEIEVVVMTAFGSVESATEAMKEGATDFITKPVNLEQLELIVSKALEHKQLLFENTRLRELAGERLDFAGMIGSGAAMEKALNIAARVAPSKATVLICGESGTGKELVAKAIHFGSPRRDGAFVAVNVAALSESLVESELFGHEKGAFTGADRMRAGRFEQADGGTLFIDEVGDIPLQVQVKLLRVLQEHQLERVGGAQPIEIDVRAIAATNRPLDDMVGRGEFREDLYYRLNVVRVELPPLRERRSDIPHLADFFVHRYSDRNDKKVTGFSKEAMDLLIKYDYPGNVRELENMIERAVVLCRGEIIGTVDLPGIVNPERARSDSGSGSFQERVAAFEINLIRDALEKADNVQTRAAEILGMSERHLRYKLNKYGLK